MPKGIIKRLFKDRGFGFISLPQGKDFFFHYRQLQGVDFNSLIEGQEVEFEVTTGRDGRVEATRVRLAQSKSK